MIVAVVFEEVVFLAVEGEFRAAYTVAHPADNGVEIGVFAHKSVGIFKACNHIDKAAVFARNAKICNARAVGYNHGIRAVCVFDFVTFNAVFACCEIRNSHSVPLFSFSILFVASFFIVRLKLISVSVFISSSSASASTTLIQFALFM